VTTGDAKIIGCAENSAEVWRTGSQQMVLVTCFGYHDSAKVRATGTSPANAVNWLAPHGAPEMRAGEVRTLATPGIGQEISHVGIPLEATGPLAVTQGWNENGGFTDMTAAFADPGTDLAFLEDSGDFLYIGCSVPFHRIVITLNTLASATVAPTFHYWNGAAWTAFAPTDASVGFSVEDDIDWTPGSLTGWEPRLINTDTTALYYVRITAGASPVTDPIENTFTLQPDDSRAKVMVQCLSMAF
jgi:hypothetical protein